eukprot:9663575-Alexandrium_andersonii.AAC.1
MSASLVGSEMCIRDRLRAAGPPSKPAPSAAVPSTSRKPAPSTRRWSVTCLLYTSDAADDM